MISTFKTVPEGMSFTVERFGRFKRVLPPGLSVIIPFIDQIGYRLDMRERKVSVKFTEMLSENATAIKGRADVSVRIVDAYKAAYCGLDQDQSIKSALDKALENHFEKLPTSDILNASFDPSAALIDAVADDLERLGAQIRIIEMVKLTEAY